jgi:hypothetical protein
MRRLILLAVAACVAAAVLAAPAAASRPVTTPVGNVTCKRNFWPQFVYIVKDADSSKANVTIVVSRKGGGGLVARVKCGWQRTNRALLVPFGAWRCNWAKGTYVWRVNAVDREGYKQRKAWPARLIIN